MSEYEKALSEFRKLEIPQDIGLTLLGMARIRLARGDAKGARAAVAEAVPALERMWKELPDDASMRMFLASGYVAMSEVAVASGECAESRDWTQKAEALWRELAATEAAAFADARSKTIPAVRCG